MKLTFEGIADLLDNYFSIRSVSIQKELNSTYYELPLLYHRGDKLRKGSIYILDSRDLPENPWIEQGTGIISIGPLPPFLNTFYCSSIILDDLDLHVPDVYSIIVTLFLKFQQYETTILKMSQRNASIQEFAKVTSEMVDDKPVWCVNIKGEAFAVFPPESDLEVDPSSPEVTSLPLFRGINSLNLADEHHHGNNVYLTSADVYGTTYNLLCRDIFEDSDYKNPVAILIIIEAGAPIIKSDYIILDTLANTIWPHIVGNYVSITNNKKSINTLFQELLNREHISEDYARSVLKKHNIPEESEFRCICLNFRNKATQGLLFSLLQNQIEQYIPEAFVAYHNDGIAIFTTNGSDPIKNAEIEETYIDLLQDCHYVAGVSDSFQILSYVPYYFEQAKIAVSFGSKVYPSKLFHYFSEYAIPYILSCASESMPTDLLCHSGVRALMEHDKANDTELCKTLKCYLSTSQNATHTAKALYIHRSSLLYRLEQIERIAQIDLSNYQELIYIMLSLEMLN